MSDRIECDGCGRGFLTDDAPGMLVAIRGPCPSCGGRFRLVPMTVAASERGAAGAAAETEH